MLTALLVSTAFITLSPPAPKTVQIKAQGARQCLEATGAQGAQVRRGECAPGKMSQVWRMEPAREGRGQYRLVSVESGLCLDVDGESRADGASIIQWPCKATGRVGNQLWTLRPAGRGAVQLVASHSNACVHVTGGRQGAVVQRRCPARPEPHSLFVVQDVPMPSRRGPATRRPPERPTHYIHQVPPPTKRDCGTGMDDPGCNLRRGGEYPLDKAAFMPIVELLTKERMELNRYDMTKNLLGKRLVTARQLGLVLDLFQSELNRLDVAKSLLGNVVDPSSAVALANKFDSSLNRQDFVEHLSKLN